VSSNRKNPKGRRNSGGQRGNTDQGRRSGPRENNTRHAGGENRNANNRRERAPREPRPLEGGTRPPVRRDGRNASNQGNPRRELRSDATTRGPQHPPRRPQEPTRARGGTQEPPPPLRRQQPLPEEATRNERSKITPTSLPATDHIEFDGAYLDPAPEEAPELGLASIPPNVRYEPEVERRSTRPPRDPQTEREMEAQIRALEARLDGLIRRSAVLEEEAPPASVTPEERTSPEVGQDSVSEAYVARNWGREALRSRLEDVDDFGFDPAYEQRLRPGLDLLYRRYFRVQCQGIDRVPAEGRAVIVANHSGVIPLDGAMLRAAFRLDHPHNRELRWLTEDFAFHLPFAGVLLNRIGAVRACPENAERLLSKDALIAVFPEGVQGVKKLFAERYQLQRFGRGGYIRLCLRMRAPLVPCAIIGAEETNPLLYRFDWAAQLLKLPFLPVTPTFPWLGPVGLLPAPTRWKLSFGEPILFDNYGPEAANDDVLVGRLSERVRNSIQSLLDAGLRDRKSVWFG